jgi:hypothetical protein
MRPVADRRLPQRLAGIRQLLIAEHAEEPDQVLVGIETDRCLDFQGVRRRMSEAVQIPATAP